ncbi:MAG: phosphotransferase [Candidatus Nanoarchaeia archaeon]|nr:phosphotransferase [Candidatus Nanoarchaeia archaeon]
MSVKSKPKDIFFELIPDKIIEYILIQYDIKNWSIIPFFSLNKTVMDLNQRTNTSRKVLIRVKNKIFFLKEFPWYCSNKKFIESELNFINFLHNHNFKVVNIMKSLKKEFFSSFNKKYYFLSNFIEGESWTKSVQESKNAGIFLGKFHKLSYKYKKNCISFKTENVFDSAEKMLNLAANYFSNKFKNNKYFKEYLIFSQNILLINKNKVIKKGYFNLTLPIHGDYNPFNLIFSKKKDIIALIDFDNFCFDNPVHDIAEGLIRFSYLKFGKLTSNYEDIPNEYNKEHAVSFINSYKKFNPLIYSKIKNYIKEVCIILAIEFSALGILCDYYEPEKIKLLLKSIKNLEKETNNIFKFIN